MVPSVVFDVPKSSPQIDMGTPEGAPVYTIKCHRSTVIFAQARQAASDEPNHAVKRMMSIHRTICLRRRVEESIGDGP
jgi:hypothetical protein